MSKTEQEMCWYPIEQISMFETVIAEQIEDAEECYANFLKVKDKPHILDNATIDRAIQIYTERMEFIEHYDRQFARWRVVANLTHFQHSRLDALSFRNKYHRTKVEELLFLIKEVSVGTIDQIMEVNDLELALKVLSGEIKI